MSFRTRCLFGIISVFVLSACVTTQKPAQPHVMPQPPAAVAPTETSMVPGSTVRPSRYAMLFDTLEVPPLKVEAEPPPSEVFLAQLQQAFIQKIRDEQLFAHVVPKAAPRERGGVLTLNATILSWDERPDEGGLEIRLGIEDMGSSCEFTHATSKGVLKRTNSATGDASTGQYEIQPLVEGTVAFVAGFMRPNPYEL